MATSFDTPYSVPLHLSNATVLITGGGTGIGLGLAQEFVKAGSRVIITGRRAEVLADARKQVASLITIQSDVSEETDRRALVAKVISEYPALNVVVHNAGVLHFSSLTQLSKVGHEEGTDDWATRQEEINTNITAVAHLTSLVTPHLLKQPEAALIFVSSLFAFTPAVVSPTYSGTKAFVHSFAVSARESLQFTRVQVYEIVPPLVKTAMSGHVGVECDVYCADVVHKLKAGDKEIGYEQSEQARLADREGQHRLVQDLTKQVTEWGLFTPYRV